MAHTPPSITINSDRLRADFDALAEIGATVSGGVSRLALSNEDLEARAWFANRIEECGLLFRDDEVGNLSGVYPCKNPSAKTFLVGSHLDTVPNGGRFDGALGVLVGLECLRTIKEANIDLPVHLEVIDFTDEEGTWLSFLGSSGLTGRLDDSYWNGAGEDSAAFRAALYRAGIRPPEVHQAQRTVDDIVGYLEIHIEQSEKLVTSKNQIGIVSKIVGRSTYDFNFYGEATHAATTTREKQRDALQAAAVFITEMHRMARERYPGGVFNCGNVIVQPGAYNVVPEVASLRVELRHYQKTILQEMDSQVVRLAHDIAKQYQVSVGTKHVLRRDVAEMNTAMQAVIESVCQEQGYPAMPIVSYAGHDAQILSRQFPSAMIFIPSQGGISHSPKEFSTWQDVEAGANVMLHTLLKLAQNGIE
ncbi:MAG: Zn-dependent hydrolase [Chloroflexota bacterium]